MNLRELQTKFDTHDKCAEFIEKLRWPDGVRCVTCGANKISRVTSSSEKQGVRKLYECLEPTCRQQFTVTSGTIMHDTHLSLQTWLCAIAIITQAKKGISARQLQRHLGLGSYKTAWFLSHRIRQAMRTPASPMGGVLEIDETYVGGKRKGKGWYEGKHNKTAVMGIVKRGGELRLESANAPTVKSGLVEKFIAEHVSPSAQMVCTDDSVIYPQHLSYLQHRHQTVNHSAREYVRHKWIHTNSIENAFSLFKRGIVGNFHKVSVKHLDRYLNEFSFRFNGRHDADLFSKTVAAIAQGKALPFAELTAAKQVL